MINIKSLKSNKKGFTLIEILAVIVILGVLLLIAIPAINKQMQRFRMEYYQKLENSIKLAGENYIDEKRFGRPTDYLHSKVIKVSELEEKKVIDEVKDYLGNKCDNTDTSYSYFLAVKMGDNKYAYTTCLKCSEDEYATDTSGEENDFCNAAWSSNNNIEFIDPTINDELLLVYYGTSEQQIREQVGFNYGIQKKDENGNILAKIETHDETLYPENINELVGRNVNTVVDLRYLLPDGTTMTRKAIIYKNNSPKVTMTYANGNSVTNKKAGDLYNNGPNEWSNGLSIKFEFSDYDIDEIKQYINIKKVQYYDSSSGTWEDTGCRLSSDKKSCSWNISNNYNKKIMFRIVNNQDKISDSSIEYSIKVDIISPTCGSNNGDTTWENSKSVTVGCNDNGGSFCSSSGFTYYYPTETFKNKKVDSVKIYDNAGNSNSCSINVYVDSTPPSSCTVTLTSNNVTVSNNETVKNDVTITIDATDNETDASGISSKVVNVTKDGVSLGDIRTTKDFKSGIFVVTPTCQDVAGNSLTGESVTFTLDKPIKDVFITYLGNGNSSGEMNVQTCKFNEDCVIQSNVFAKTGYHFKNWKTGTTIYNENQVVKLTSDITLNAQWEANKYTISFDGNGNSSGTTSNVICTYDQDCTLTSNGYVKTGYTFGGWSYGNDVYQNQAIVNNLTTVNNTTIKMKAIWSINKYTLTYDSQNGTDCTNVTQDYNQAWGELCNPTRDGYIFEGWFTGIDGKGTEVTSSTLATANITVYAKWKMNKVTLTYDSQNGTSCTNKTQDYNQAWGDLCSPTREGYIFGGWFTEKDGSGTEITASTLATANITVYARWTYVGTVTITYNSSGGNGCTTGKTVTKGTTWGTLCKPSKAEYTFSGWYTAIIGGQEITSSTTALADITVYARWTKTSGTGGCGAGCYRDPSKGQCVCTY